jgi:hypothetical protein
MVCSRTARSACQHTSSLAREGFTHSARFMDPAHTLFFLCSNESRTPDRVQGLGQETASPTWADIVACSSLFVCSDRMRFPVGQNRRAGAFQNPSSLSTLRPFLSSRNKRDEASAASEQRHHEPPQWRVRPPVGGRATVERLHGVANQ